MKSKSIILAVFSSLILISCDSSIFIEVGFTDDLSSQNYSLIDYDFILAHSESSDKLYFEFVTNRELDPSTVITFLDQSGSVIAVKELGLPHNLIGENIEISGERSYAYSIHLDNLRSISLVHEIIIGDE